MFFRIFYPCFLLMCLLLSLFISEKVEAIAPPVNNKIIYAHMFNNVHESGDMLLICRYFLEYYVEPVEDSSETFFLCLKDSQTGKFAPQRKLPLDGYGHNVQAIYISKAKVTELDIHWAGDYSAVVTSNPSLFSTVSETSQFLDFNSWADSGISVTAGQENLRLGILSQSRQLEKVRPDLKLLTDTSSGTKLSIAGKNFWQLRYDGTNYLPGLSVTGAEYTIVDNLTYDGKYIYSEIPGVGLSDPGHWEYSDKNGDGRIDQWPDSPDSTWVSSGMFGSNQAVKEAFTNLGDSVGIPYWQAIAFLVLCVPSFMIIAGTVYGISGNTKMASILAAPMMFVISMLVPDALLMILTGLVAMIVVFIMWRFV